MLWSPSSHLSFLWSKNKAFLCLWTELGLILSAWTTRNRRTPVGDQLGRIGNKVLCLLAFCLYLSTMLCAHPSPSGRTVEVLGGWLEDDWLWSLRTLWRGRMATPFCQIQGNSAQQHGTWVWCAHNEAPRVLGVRPCAEGITLWRHWRRETGTNVCLPSASGWPSRGSGHLGKGRNWDPSSVPSVNKRGTGRENALATPKRGTATADPGHYPRRQMVQTDEEWWGGGGEGILSWRSNWPPEKPQLTLDVGQQPVEFLVNSGLLGSKHHIRQTGSQEL